MSWGVLEAMEAVPPVTVQDAGRLGYRRMGIPPSGAMDRSSLHLANRLLGNPEDAPALECLHGARFRVLETVHLALVGYGHARAWCAGVGDEIELSSSLPGVWHMLALPGGVESRRWLNSASICFRAGLGEPLPRKQVISCLANPLSGWPKGIASRYPAKPHHPESACIEVWKGPQWTAFSGESRASFVRQAWTVSRHCGRSGYRLQGDWMEAPSQSLISEPVRVGTIQIPPDGQPIVCLYDGPTVGGYAKIAIVDPDSLDQLVQTPPGCRLNFKVLGS